MRELMNHSTKFHITLHVYGPSQSACLNYNRQEVQIKEMIDHFACILRSGSKQEQRNFYRKHKKKDRSKYKERKEEEKGMLNYNC